MRYYTTLCLLVGCIHLMAQVPNRFTMQRFTYGNQSTVSFLGHQFGWHAENKGTTLLTPEETKKLMWRCTGEPMTESAAEKKAGARNKRELLPKHKKGPKTRIIPGTDPREDPNLFVYHEEGTRLWGKISYSNTYLFDVSWENDRSPNCLRIVNTTGEMLYIDTYDKPHKYAHKRTFRALPDGETRRILPPRQESIAVWRKQSEDNEPASQLCTTIPIPRTTKTAILRSRNKLIWAEHEKRRPRNSD